MGSMALLANDPAAPNHFFLGTHFWFSEYDFDPKNLAFQGLYYTFEKLSVHSCTEKCSNVIYI